MTKSVVLVPNNAKIALPPVNFTNFIPNCTEVTTIPPSTKQLIVWGVYHVCTFTEVRVKAQVTKLPLNVPVVATVPPVDVNIPPKYNKSAIIILV